jgi:Fe-S cluster assembly iron-binding protein IscA
MSEDEQAVADVVKERKRRREQQLDYVATQMAVAMNMARTAEEQVMVAKDALKYLSDDAVEYVKKNLNKRMRG